VALRADQQARPGKTDGGDRHDQRDAHQQEVLDVFGHVCILHARDKGQLCVG
jgi:hypothetical protein